jgi:hypothetical protein
MRTRGNPSGPEAVQDLIIRLDIGAQLCYSATDIDTNRLENLSSPYMSGAEGTIGGLLNTKLRGVKKVAAQTVFTLAAYNLTRMGGCLPGAGRLPRRWCACNSPSGG